LVCSSSGVRIGGGSSEPMVLLIGEAPGTGTGETRSSSWASESSMSRFWPPSAYMWSSSMLIGAT
jgi:hypothetical protein